MAARRRNTARDRRIVRLARDARHMTHAQIGAAAGTSRSTVIRVLRTARIGSASQRTDAARTRVALERVESSMNWKVHQQAAGVTDLVLRRAAVSDRFHSLDKIVDVTNAHPAALRSLAGHEHYWVRHSVARHPNCPPAAIARLAADEDTAVRAAAASNTSCRPGLLRMLARDSDNSVRLSAARNPNTPTGSVVALVGDTDRDICCAAIANPHCPTDILLQHHTDEDTAAAVAANPNCPAGLMRRLAARRGPVRRSLAANSNCPAELLDRLGGEGGIVTQRVAANSNTPTVLLERLIANPETSRRSRGYARANLRTRNTGPVRRPDPA